MRVELKEIPLGFYRRLHIDSQIALRTLWNFAVFRLKVYYCNEFKLVMAIPEYVYDHQSYQAMHSKGNARCNFSELCFTKCRILMQFRAYCTVSSCFLCMLDFFVVMRQVKSRCRRHFFVSLFYDARAETSVL